MNISVLVPLLNLLDSFVSFSRSGKREEEGRRRESDQAVSPLLLGKKKRHRREREREFDELFDRNQIGEYVGLRLE